MKYNVGNWIKDGGQYFQIEEICKLSTESLNQNIGARYNNGGFWCELVYLEPIQLTEDILLKCGFEKDVSEKTYYTNIPNEFHIRIEEKVFWVYFDEQPKHPITCLFNLHELQNLFYALCGNEIKISL